MNGWCESRRGPALHNASLSLLLVPTISSSLAMASLRTPPSLQTHSNLLFPPLHRKHHSSPLQHLPHLHPFRPLLPGLTTLAHPDSPSLSLCISAIAEVSQRDQTEIGCAKSSIELFACPVCFDLLTRKGPVGMTQASISRSGFQCPKCKKAYSNRDVFLDLTVVSGTNEYEEYIPSGTELFRSPFVSFLYERGWRQSFARSGFPGPNEELIMAEEFLKPAAGGVLLDVSCGSGLFSRRFAKSNVYSAVVALDFSENMLRQCYEFMKEDRSLAKANLSLVRADVARLPFATRTIDAVHAGAALHCWPSPSAGVAEISRILRPGGVFVATTFLTSTNDTQLDIFEPFEQAMRRSWGRYWREPELKDLCDACGLVDYKMIRKGSFIMLSARKPD